MKNIQLYSDSHYLVQEPVKNIKEYILKERKEQGNLFLLGDIFDVPDSEVALESTNKSLELLDSLSKEYDKIVYVLGNHEFRDKQLQNGIGYDLFKQQLPSNVVFPDKIIKPTITEIDNKKVLVGNLFYDMEFLPSVLFGFSKEEIYRIYKKFPDGKYLFDGEIEVFNDMKRNLRTLMNLDIDIIATHSLPHPSLVQFLSENPDKVKEKLKKYGDITIKSPADRHYKQAEEKGITIQEFINGYNAKSYFMGSNILENTKKIKDGLICTFGHSHRNVDKKIEIGDKEVYLKSKQYPKK